MEDFKKENNIGLVILNITLVCLIFSFSMMIYKLKPGKQVKVDGVKDFNQKIVLDNQKIKARSFVVYDVNSGTVLYGKNIDKVMPLASLVKIMTVYTARNLADPNTIVSVKKDYLDEEGDTGLLVGEKWRLKDLSDFSLTTSSNDGSRMIASAIGSLNSKNIDSRNFFVKSMNDIAVKEGFENLHFNNETGLDNLSYTGGEGSAKDVARLVSIALKKYPDMFEKTVFPKVNISSLNKIHNASNTNIYVDEISGIIGSKTGFTDKAGGNLMTVFGVGLNRPIVAVVLGSTLNGRFEDMIYITKETINQLSN